ncbi:MAG TPA: glycosyltransferase family 1 protein [Actinomycetota bacterium]|nr:glycosyltransferase family 1 protein [Actinomycetota bacterium]
MRIAVDARPAAFPYPTGVGQYTRQLLRLLPRLDPQSTYLAWYLNARGVLGGPRRMFTDIAAPNLREQWTPLPARWFRPLEQRFELPRVEWLVGFDVFFAPNFIPPPTRTNRLVMTVHDVAFRLFPETAPHGTLRWLTRLDRALRQAARIIVVSEQTKRDLLEQYGVAERQVVVVPNGVDANAFQHVTDTDVSAAREQLGIAGPYLLFLGGIEPRKNLPAVVRAFARLPPDVRPLLVIAGWRTEWNPEGWNALQQALGEVATEIRSRIHVTGYVPEKRKAALLAGAEALVYPSRYEGFGLQVLEAMAAGTPVLTSNVSALPEVAGDAALLVDPTDLESIAGGMEKLLRDHQLRKDLRERGRARAERFSWEETARRTVEVLHQA